jgi:hypothetical protein
MSSSIHIGTIQPRPNVVLPIVDCTGWYVAGITPKCREGLDVETCETCSSRKSRNGDLKNPPVYGRGEKIPYVQPAPVSKLPPTLRGLGDVVAAATKAVGIRQCGGCKKRQEALNQAFPFGKKEDNAQA